MTNSGSGPFFGKKHGSIQSAFPQIKDITVKVEETDMVQTQKTRTYDINSVPGKEPCTNPKCTNRGIRLDTLISGMVANNETSQTFKELCKGAEKMGQKQQQSCPHTFEVEIDITY